MELQPVFIAHAQATHPGPGFRLGSMTELDAPKHSVAGHPRPGTRMAYRPQMRWRNWEPVTRRQRVVVTLAAALLYAVLFAGIGGLIVGMDDSWQRLAIEGFVVGTIATWLMLWIRATSDHKNWPPRR